MGALTEAPHARHLVKEPEDVGHVARFVGNLAGLGGATQAEAGRAQLAVTELATNLLRHAAPGGQIFVRTLGAGSARGVEIISVDDGPGMRNPRAPGGARPTAGAGLGVGLAAVARLSTRFDIHSRPGEGTVVLSRHSFGEPPKRGAFDAGGVSFARPGESVCGDAWAIDTSPCTALLIDGLGHGPDARVAAEAGTAAFRHAYVGDCEDYIRRANTAMRTTRGGVLALARIDPMEECVVFLGVGNIEGCIFLQERTTRLMSRNGVVGVNATPPLSRATEHPWGPGATLFLHSDGVKVDLDPRGDRSLFQHDASVIAAVGMRDGWRGTDDATLVVIKDLRRTSPP